MKPIIPVVLGLAIILLGYSVWRSNAGKDEVPQESVTLSPTESPAASPTSSPLAEQTSTQEVGPKAGAYVTYSSDVIASTSGKKVLFFHATWCPQCRALDKDIIAGPIPADTTIIRVDYDTNQALRKQYGVTSQTTLVLVDDAGNLVKKYVAYDEPTLASLKANLL